MTAATTEDLVRAESGLTRAFVGYLAAVFVSSAWSMYWPARPPAQWLNLALITIMVFMVQIGLQVWYAFAAGAAAKTLGISGRPYVVWIIAAPFLALLPIPLVSWVIAASPLSIKFLLGGQLQTAIRDHGNMHYA